MWSRGADFIPIYVSYDWSVHMWRHSSWWVFHRRGLLADTACHSVEKLEACLHVEV